MINSTRPDVPDPSASLSCKSISDHDHGKGRARVAQHCRRSNIFAAARTLMKIAGYDGVQMQATAAHCNIFAQTIYNLVGAKAQLMEQAAADKYSS